MVKHLTYDRLCHVPHLPSSVPKVEVVPPHRHRPSSSVSFKHASGDHVTMSSWRPNVPLWPRVNPSLLANLGCVIYQTCSKESMALRFHDIFRRNFYIFFVNVFLCCLMF